MQDSLDEQTIRLIFQSTQFRKTKKEIKQVLEKMIESGSYYRNLENNVSKGVCFVLGTALPET